MNTKAEWAELLQSNAKEEAKIQKRKRVTSLAGVFSRALSVLTGRKISVHVVEQPLQGAPAWSSTNEVWLNLPEIKDDFTARSITSLNGLSFHELGHLRYTPRNGSAIIQRISNSDNSHELWSAFNCLEDSRIENLLIAYLPSIKSWITATIVDYLLDNQELLDRAFPLIYGRYYLPTELRQQVMDSFINPDDIAELKSIIDDYTSLIHDGSNADHAFYLVSRFAELVSNIPPCENINNQTGEVITVVLPNPHGHDNRPSQGYESSSNRPAKRQDQQRDIAKVLANRNTDIAPTPKPEPKEDTGASNQPSPKEDTGNSGGKKFEVTFNDSSDDLDSSLDSDDDSDSPSKDNGKGAGKHEGTTGDNSQVTDSLNDLLSDVVKELSKEINQIAKQLGINDLLEGGNASTPNKAKYKEVPVPAELSTISNAFGRELELIRAEYDPMWLRNRDTGKVNAYRYLRGDDYETIFDEWSEGRDDVTEIEAVILLDKSGSMEGANADNAYKSMWAIKKALEKVNARTTVCLFDSRTTLLYGADETAGTTIRDSGANGGTDPQEALLYAKRVLAETEKPIRILFMITDGYWNTNEGELSIEAMRSAGVLTCQAIVLGDYNGEVPLSILEENRHGFELVTAIKTTKDILSLGKELVRLSIKRNLSVSA